MYIIYFIIIYIYLSLLNNSIFLDKEQVSEKLELHAMTINFNITYHILADIRII